MKITAKSLIIVAFMAAILLNTSCRKEEFDFQGASPEQALEANSAVANLLLRTTMNDGSVDNIIDNASCFSLQLPVTVVANGTEVVVSSSAGYDAIEAIFDESAVDTDTMVIQFPVTLIFLDHSEVLVADQAEFDTYASTCSGEDQPDDDIECIDIKYPMAISLFNTAKETLNSLSFTDDKSLYEFIFSIQETDVANIQFPVGLILSDGTIIQAADIVALEDTINTYKDDCDEDDNNDFSDDDCIDCNPTEFGENLTSCAVWTVNALSRDNQNLTNLYTDFVFNFQEDGTLSVTVLNTTDVFVGTWSFSGSGNDMQLEINVAGLDDFNGIWSVNESAQSNSQGLVVVRIGTDTLRLKNGC
ncbi:MAG: hypothetical protein ABGX00_10135 [Allomuricauda sp.]